MEWKLTYVGSAEDDAHDQVLDTVLVGPVGVGSYKFVFQADPPDATKIPQSDVLGVTVLLLTCSYDGTEFIRVGYYVNNEYADEALREDPPATVRLDRVVRNILAEKPRVHARFPCEFDAPAIPAAGEMDEEETENQPVAAGGLHAAPADNAHDAHAYAQNGAQMLYGAAGAYARPPGARRRRRVRARGRRRRAARRAARGGSGTEARRRGTAWRRCRARGIEGAPLSIGTPARRD